MHNNWALIQEYFGIDLRVNEERECDDEQHNNVVSLNSSFEVKQK